MSDFAYEGARYAMRPGELLCIVTDGVTEAENRAGALYGSARVEAILPADRPRADHSARRGRCAARRRGSFRRGRGTRGRPHDPGVAVARSRRRRLTRGGRHRSVPPEVSRLGFGVRSADDYLDPPVARLRHAVGGWHQQLPFSPSHGHDVLGRNPVLDEPGTDDISALARQRIVVLIAADRVGMPDDQDIGDGPLRDFRKYRLEGRLDSSVNSSLLSMNWTVNRSGRLGCAASAGPKSAWTSSGFAL